MQILSNLSINGTLGLNSVADANTDTDKFLVIDSSGIVKYRTGAELYSDIGAGGAAAYTSVLQHTVKAGVALTKGQAVYVTSADGTNMIVGKASNASEATSSKTLGLIVQDLAINDQGFVITEGLLAGLDTSTAAAGDPVWLGTDGNLIYGLLNKPYAPNHLVFIGIVTRAQQNNGEIFVKVQNGFELQELHNVQITSTPSDNAVLAYETSTSLYKMKSIPTLLGYTPVTNARSITINGTTYDLSADRSWSVGTHTGNLTTGYVPKATGATTLTDSLIYDNGSGIGINTSSPYESSAFKLDVNGGLLIKNTSGTTAQLILINSNPATGGNNGFVQLSAGGNTETAFGQWQTYYGMSVAAGALRLQPAGGQVLIGTTTTSAFLTDINGTLRVSGQLTLGSTISNNTYVYTMPGASGTLALVSQIPSLSGYLTIASADATYLTQSSAASIYLSQTSASNTYLTISGASSTYLSQANASNTYLTISGASSIYLSQTSASNTYLSINSASSIYLSQTSASNTYLTINNAASTYVSLSGSYANPSWITSLAWSKISGAPAFITGINSSMVTTALGYTPYNSSNPAGYITASALSAYAPNNASFSDANALTTGGFFTAYNASNVPSGLSSLDMGILNIPLWGSNSGGERYTMQLFANLDTNTNFFIRKFKYFGAVNQSDWYTLIHSGNYSSYRGNQLVSPNGGTVVAADSAMPDSGHSFIHTLALGPSGNDGHILGMTWAGTTTVYGAQIWVDTDPNNRMAFRSRSSSGVWTGWNEVIHSSNYNGYAPTLTGGGASGTWGISITGNSAYASSAGNADTVDGYHASGLLKLNEWNGNLYLHTDGRIYGTIFYDANDSTYYLNPNSTSYLYSVRAVNDVTTESGQGRFGGWYTGTGYTGAAVEVGFSGGNGNVISYNRITSAYQPLYVSGSNLYLQQQSGLVYINSALVRQGAGQGWLSGNYGTAESTATSGAIYSIGGSYVPTSSSLNNMYGIGYTYGGVAGLGASTAWGLYVVAGQGSAKVFLDADNGVGTATGSWRAPVFYDSANTSYYGDFDSTSRMYQINVNYIHSQYTSITGPRWDTSFYVLQSQHWYAHSSTQDMYLGESNVINVRNTAIAVESFRAPIFYDSNDTTYYGDFNGTSRFYQAIVFGDSSRYSAVSTTINGTGAGDKLILYGNASNYDARVLVGTDYDFIFKSQGSPSNKGMFRFYSGNNAALALEIRADQNVYAPATVYSAAYRGNANVSGTGEAVYAPAGIYSTGTNWLYGTMYLNVNSINDTADIRTYNSGYSFRARYTAGSDIYHSSLNWYGLQLGNNGDNYIIGGRTATGGNLTFYVNNTSDFTSINGVFAAKMHSTGRTSFGQNSDNGYQVQVYGSLYSSDWIRVAGGQGLYFESYGGGWHMTESSYVRSYNGKSLHMNYGSVDYVGSLYIESGGQGVHLQGNSGSYGSLQVTSSRNGWSGIRFTASNVNIMANNNEAGFYHNGVGWQFLWSGGTAYVYKGGTGAGTQATVLDSSNYSSWAQPASSAINTSNIGSQSVSSAGTITGRSRGSFTVGGSTSTFYPVAFQIGSGATGEQGISVLQIERGGYDEPGYSSTGFGTFHCRIRAKADGWGYGASYIQVEANAYTIPMLADVTQQNQTSQLIVWLRGGQAYRWYDVEGGWSLNFSNSSGGSYSTFNGNSVYDPTGTNTIGGNFKYQQGWGNNYISGRFTAGNGLTSQAQMVCALHSSATPDYSNPLWIWAAQDNDAIVIQNTTSGGTPPKIYFRDTNGTIQTSNTLLRLRTSNSDSLSAWLNGSTWNVTGDVVAYASDRRLKENIKTIPNALEKINALSGVTFDWNNVSEKAGFVPKSKYNEVGVLAQDVQKVLPQAVEYAPFDRNDDGTSRSGKDYLTVKYEKIVPLLIEAVKEQQKQIEELKSKLDAFTK